MMVFITFSNGDNFLYNLQDSYNKLIVLSDYHFKLNYTIYRCS